MADILLIQPPVEDFYFTFKRSIPYGLASIAASLKQKGFSVEILGLPCKKQIKKNSPARRDALSSALVRQR